MSQVATPEFLPLLTVFLEVWELSLPDTLNSIKPFSCDIFIPACNRNNLFHCFTLLWDAVAAMCTPFWFWGLSQNRSRHPSLFPGFLFTRFCLFVLEILLEQLHVAFVTRRDAQHDVTLKALDLGLWVFCLALVSDLLRDLRHSMSPLCGSFFSWCSSACLFPLDATFFWAGTCFPDIHTHTLM